MYKKYTPKITVNNNETTDFKKKLFIKEWWAQVTVIPLVNKITVFNKGTEYTDKGIMPLGGQTIPISTEGAREQS